MEIDQEKKEGALGILKQEARDRKLSCLHSRRESLKDQFCFVDKTMWAVQGAVYASAALLGTRLYVLGVDSEDMLAAVMVMAGVIGIFSMMGVFHGFYSGMAELSGSCYFNVSQMTLLRLIFSGGMNLAVLFGGVLFIGVGWEIPLVQTGLYVLVPFLFTQCCALGAALTRGGRRNPCLPCLAGVLGAALCWAAASFPEVYRGSALAFWGAAFALGATVFGWQIKRLFHVLEEGEILCTN